MDGRRGRIGGWRGHGWMVGRKGASEGASKRTSERGGKAIEAKQDRGRVCGLGAFVRLSQLSVSACVG
jgi:hypothetical protein